jgi:serine/threonine protein kinase
MTLTSSLEQIVVRSGALDFRRASHYVVELAEDLADCYRSHAFHGAVSPANTWLDPSGRLHLGEREAELSHYYLAPEQALHGQKLDEKTDVYSLGATFFFCLTGEPPFARGSVSEILLQHQVAEPPRLEERRPETPVELAKLCAHMLMKDRTMRCPSVQHVIATVSEWLAT